MARQPVAVDMNIGSGRVIVISVPQSIAEYFNIPKSTAALPQKTVKKKAHTRRIYDRDSLSTNVIKTVAVSSIEYADQGNVLGGQGIGKLIKLPTELQYDPGTPGSPFRLVSMRVPQIATNYVVAQWINTKFTAHKPTYYITQSGVAYPVNVPTLSDPNPGNSPPPTTP